MDSYLLVVPGVNHCWRDESEVRGSAVGTTAQPHQNQGIKDMKMTPLLLIEEFENKKRKCKNKQKQKHIICSQNSCMATHHTTN